MDQKPTLENLDEYFTEVLDPSPVHPDVLPPSSILDAQELFLRFTPVADIARITGVPIGTLRELVYKKDGWLAQRNQMHKEVSEKVKQLAVKKLRTAFSVNIRLITKGLLAFEKKVQARPTQELDLEEIQTLTGILSRLHKAKLLEEDPNGEKRLSTTPQELLRALGNDPYLRKAIIANTTAAETIEFAKVETKDDDREAEGSDSLAYTHRP